MIIFMMAVRIILIVISYWNMKVTKSYVYVQLVFMMVAHTMPQDFGSHHMRLVNWINWGNFLVLSFNYKFTILAISA